MVQKLLAGQAAVTPVRQAARLNQAIPEEKELDSRSREVVMVAKSQIEHVVLIVKENHGFDNYFGTFTGANGLKLPRSPNPP